MNVHWLFVWQRLGKSYLKHWLLHWAAVDMDIFLGKAGCPLRRAETVLTRMAGHAAGDELCNTVNRKFGRRRRSGLILHRSGITITASFAIKQSARLLRVCNL